VPIEFHGTFIYAAIINGTPHVALPPICEALTIDWPSQYHRIKRHPVLSSTIVITTMLAGDGKKRNMACLPLDKINGWLFGISSARIRDPARRALLIEYQRECFDVLARHFGAAQQTGQVPALVPVPVSVPGPGRYLVHVGDDKQVTVTSLKGKSVVDSDGAWKLHADMDNVCGALKELASRIRIFSGSVDLSAVEQPLRVTLSDGWVV